MVCVEHDWYRAHPVALAMLAAAESAQVCWQDWGSVAVSVVEVCAKRSVVDPEEWPKLGEAVAGSC